MVLLKLGLVQRKVLLFISSINEGYRLRLFLEAFGIKSAVLNSELPLNSRHHILQVSISFAKSVAYSLLPLQVHCAPKPRLFMYLTVQTSESEN